MLMTFNYILTAHTQPATYICTLTTCFVLQTTSSNHRALKIMSTIILLSYHPPQSTHSPQFTAWEIKNSRTSVFIRQYKI